MSSTPPSSETRDAIDEFIAERDAPTGQHDFTEAEQVLPNFEAFVEEQRVEPEATGGFFNPEATRERPEALWRANAHHPPGSTAISAVAHSAGSR